MSLTLLLLFIFRFTPSTQFNLYHEQDDLAKISTNQFQYHCLHYYVIHNFLPIRYSLQINTYSKAKFTYPNQIIPYCFRPVEQSHSDILDVSDKVHNNVTFRQMRLLNVTSEQLYSWFAPMVLLEQYEMYLSGNDSLSETLFYNCTLGWFGPLCQYSFRLENKSLLFADIVARNFELKRYYHQRVVEETTIFSNLSCYMHLQCNRGGPLPACLDWREICDGKVDCIDGRFDEQDCDQLEINECDESEYRCHNGQCIPQEFYLDNMLIPECLDGTDEAKKDVYLDYCAFDPSFRCEDVMSQPRSQTDDVDVVCGDGSFSTYTTSCVNKRDLLLKKALIQSTFNISVLCRNMMACLTELDECQTRGDIKNHCPPLFQFPGAPVLFGHVTLLYMNSSTKLSSISILLPTYVCFDSSLCPFPSLAPVPGYSACWPLGLFAQLFTTDRFADSWDILIGELKSIFQGCPAVPGGYCQHNHTLYTCNSTLKCISKHRLVDGIKDCLLEDDEDSVESCSLNNSRNRFFCENKCLSPIMFAGPYDSCSRKRGFDVHISFQTICDGLTELAPILIDGQNYTDETDCNLWPCNNSYTRCNGIWNCINGTDELNCPRSTCPSLSQICFVMPHPNLQAMCSAVSVASSTYVKCANVSSEHQLCQKVEVYFSRFPMMVPNIGGRPPVVDLCLDRPQCLYSNDDEFCTASRRLCVLEHQSAQGTNYRFRCTFANGDKARTVEFSLKNSRTYPENFQHSNSQQNIPAPEEKRIRHSEYSFVHLTLIWRCNRGITIFVRRTNRTDEPRCLCPPSYYGDLCQYQNQRVSVTLHVRASMEWRQFFSIVLTLVDDEMVVNSHEIIEYLPVRDCDTKFSVNLLFATRPKPISKNYSVRIDVFKKQSLVYIASWLFPIRFAFLPVNRMALQIIIPVDPLRTCSLHCGVHGRCLKYQNNETPFCQCDSGWSGLLCNTAHVCDCANSSVCIGPSICLCPSDKFGPRCYAKRKSCRTDSCMHDGVCVMPDERIAREDITCNCRDGFFGPRCQFRQIEVRVNLRQLDIRSFLLVHFIELSNQDEFTLLNLATTFTKVGLYDTSLTVYRTFPFHIMLLEMRNDYYLTVLQETSIESGIISTEVNPSRRCVPLNELFDVNFVRLHLIRRIKHYHLPCQQRPTLACFYDDTHICFCNIHRHANCLRFDHNITHDCRGVNYCEHDGQCFQDDLSCPTASACFCADCYYGSRCQLSTKGFSLSLDIILGYHILARLRLTEQPLVTQVSAAIAMIIVLLGLVSSCLSLITFQSKNVRDHGCGIYLFVSSITSVLILLVLTWKFWFLLVSQMNGLTDRSLLQFNCLTVDFLLRILLTSVDWLNACVSVERMIAVARRVRFSKVKSKQAAKWIVIGIFPFTILTSLQDPLHRALLVDEDDQRIWCITKYSSAVQIWNSSMIFFHSLLPFALNMLSVGLIIFLAARHRSHAHVEKPVLDKIPEQQREQVRAQFEHELRQQFYRNIRKQLREHKHLIISAVILVFLTLPRLIIWSLSGCMKSTRHPWLFLLGYFVSYLPPAFIFAIFVLPSTTYKKEFRAALGRLRRRLFAT